DVGRENLDAGRTLETIRVLAEQHRDGVRFLSGRTTGHPNTHLVILFFPGKELRNLRFEGRKRVAVTEKMGDADQQVLEERARFDRMGANELQVFWNTLDGIDLEPARDPAQNRGAFVMADMVASLRPDIRQHLRHG